jgi:hypothetical protein
VRNNFRWSVVLEPLAAFCREPRRAPDLLVRRAGTPVGTAAEASAGPAATDAPAGTPAAGGVAEASAAPATPGGQRTVVQLARHHYQEGGLSQVANRAANKLRRFVNKL